MEMREMQTSIKYLKTEKGRYELAPGVRTLTLRERSFLLMATGHRTLADISKSLPGNSVEIANQLLEKGFIAVPTAPAPAAQKLDMRESADESADESTALQNAGQIDVFEGKKSLAATRMYLFDMSERIFSRKDPALADRLRSSLREARDRESMLEVSAVLLEVIERLAGSDRANHVRERIAKLLPPEVSH
jgi:hypothetical protein